MVPILNFYVFMKYLHDSYQYESLPKSMRGLYCHYYYHIY